ncbi:MAG: outer membrane protein [Gammaproteobacteria bacterium]|nr:outer membrane protein [Gammaproteobacteria bacterium]
MPTLTRNGSAKYRAGAQVSNRSGARIRLLFALLWQAIERASGGIGVATRFSVAAVLMLTAIALCAASPAYAADPQPYRVDMASTGDSTLDATLKATSELLTLRKSAPVSPFGLIGRGQGDLERLKTVLDSFGYYQSYVEIRIDGLPLDDPRLGDELSARAPGNEAQVKITFSIGPLYHLRHIEIDGEVPKAAQGALGLTSGMPAVASEVLAGGQRLLAALQDQGYAFAKVDPPVAYEDPPNRVLDVRFHVVVGSPVQIGEIAISGLRLVHESFVRARLLVHTGELYGATKIEHARRDLLGLAVFSAVSVDVGTKADSSGRVPLTFRTRERPQHGVSLSAAYSSDLGGSAGVTWTNRNVSGKADQLTLAASAINLGGATATTGMGYDTSAKYLIPDFKQRDQSLQVAVGALKQSLEAYDQTAFTSGVTVNRKLSSIWSASAGVSAEEERINQESINQQCIDQQGNPQPCLGPDGTLLPGVQLQRTTYHYTLLALPLSVLYNSTGLESPLEDARHGMRASLTVTPTLSIGSPNTQFVITQANIAAYFDLKGLGLGLSRDPGRSVLALRALGGLAAGASQTSLPPDQRFYAGGGGTIRGYRYQSVGPTFAVSGNPIGGTAISVGTVEFRQRIGTNLGMAVFVDGGQVSANLNPLAGTLMFGAGAGVRYYTPIGAIRVDLALPLRRRYNSIQHRYTDDAFEVYIGLGQAF